MSLQHRCICLWERQALITGALHTRVPPASAAASWQLEKFEITHSFEQLSHVTFFTGTQVHEFSEREPGRPLERWPLWGSSWANSGHSFSRSHLSLRRAALHSQGAAVPLTAMRETASWGLIIPGKTLREDGV